MISSILKALQFLVANSDVFELVEQVITAGVPKDALTKALKDLLIVTSDEAVKEELATIAAGKAASK